MKKIRIFSLAAVASLALTAALASAAQAAPEFHCAATNWSTCIIEPPNGGSNDNMFSLQGAKFKCLERSGVPGARLEGIAAKATSTIELKFAYSGCTLFGVKANVTAEGCVYRYHLTGESSPYAANTDLVCEPGKAIVISAPSLPCTVTIGSQSNLSGLTFTNKAGSPSTLGMSFSMSGITYTSTGAGCFWNSGTFSDMVMIGTNTLGGFENVYGQPGQQVSLSIF